jgi:hypothetical protein
VPPSLERILEPRSFCSLNCVLVYILEVIETLDSMDSPEGERMVKDLHEVYRTTVGVFTGLFDGASPS